MYETVGFGGRIVMLGFGSIGQATLPTIPRHFEMPMDRVTVLEEAGNRERFERFAA
jgi:homospermidine synthase